MNTPEEYKEQELKSKKRSVVGIIFIVVGIALIAEKLNIITDVISDVIISWQMLLIGIGVINIVLKENYRTGLILIAVGSLFITPEIFDIPFEIEDLFGPAIFVIIGVIMLTVRNRHKVLSKDESSENFIDLLTFMGGGKRKITSDKFLGGKVTSIFGGSEIDLTSADIDENEPLLDVFTMFGGCEIVVPRNWDVHVDVTSIFGGFDDKRGPVQNSLGEPNKVLRIKGFTIFGGGEVKSY